MLDPALLDNPQKFNLLTTSVKGREIMRVATTLFNERGFDAVSVQDVADGVGILKGSLYHYIGSKDDLLYAIVFEIHVSAIERLKMLKASKGRPDELLRKVIIHHILSATSIIEESSVFYDNFKKMGSAKKESLIKHSDAYEEFVKRLITAGKESGIFKSNQDTKIIVNGILGMMNSIHRWYNKDGPISAQKIAETYADIILNGVVVAK